MTLGRRESKREIAAKILHMISPVTTVNRPLNVTDCVMSSYSGMYVLVKLYCCFPITTSKMHQNHFYGWTILPWGYKGLWPEMNHVSVMNHLSVMLLNGCCV